MPRFYPTWEWILLFVAKIPFIMLKTYKMGINPKRSNGTFLKPWFAHVNAWTPHTLLERSTYAQLDWRSYVQGPRGDELVATLHVRHQARTCVDISPHLLSRRFSTNRSSLPRSVNHVGMPLDENSFLKRHNSMGTCVRMSRENKLLTQISM